MISRLVRSHLYRARSESGVAAIELAIVLPLLFLILFGIISFGTLFYNYIVITNAAREGARWGSINVPATTVGNACSPPVPTPPAQNPCTVAASYANGLLINYGGSNTITPTAIVETVDTLPILRVTINYQFQGIGFFKTLFSNGLTAKSSMYLEP